MLRPAGPTDAIPPPDPIAEATAAGLRTEVCVVGAGITGLVLGLALAQAGIDVVVAGPPAGPAPGRTVALLEGSIRLLDRLGLWPDLAGEAEPLRIMRIVDDTGSLFRIPPVSFRAEEIERPWFGCNIPNDVLLDRLAAAARLTPGLRLIDRRLALARPGDEPAAARFDDGRGIEVELLAACDGRGSPTRKAAGITTRSWQYPQDALTAILRHDGPHDGVSTEFHTRQGPFTLVPLPGRADAPHRSSLVWVMRPEEADRRAALDPAALATAIERQSRRLLGGVEVEGPVGRFPIGGLVADRMAGPRLALVGEAAHAFPPIGAQGLNLGLRDVAALSDLVVAAKGRRADLGGEALLGRYERSRRGDVALRTLGVDALNRSLLADHAPIDLVRGMGLLALGHIAPLRRAAMRGGLMADR
ncbi:MAG TPA: FAD-dependent monooxygenase [Lichenihabitans sp.]|jgi:2-octaprenyl-6-methoxyphenol hydroxylase|nr:FAD-dependent monooxygenase [Lichenihabitans sp.]